MLNPKSPAGLRLGIVNSMTLVGNELKTILRERAFPFDRITLLDSTGKEGGALTEINDEPAVVSPVSPAELEDLDLVFFCGPAESNRQWIARHVEDRFVAVDLSQPTTTEGAHLAIAGVNLDEITSDSRLIVSPHPVAIPIALILHQVEQLARVEFCTATVIQPASEFEQEGIEELARQTVSVLNVQQMPQEVFDRQVAFNLFPATLKQEEFIVSQVRQLVDPDSALALLVTQGTIFHGHTFSLFVKTQEPLATERITEMLGRNAAIALPEGDQEFGTIDAAGRDEVLIAEVRQDPSMRGGFWVWAVCDNLRRSSALNAILVAEKVLFGGAAN